MTDKEKQIREIAKIACYVCEFGHTFNGECDLGHDDPCSIALEAGEKLYETGYRKPIEGEWIFQQNGNGVCSNCKRQDGIDDLARFCRYCGAKMKGGAE